MILSCWLGFNYEEDNADLLPEIFRAINNLAMVFSNRYVHNHYMVEQLQCS